MSTGFERLAALFSELRSIALGPARDEALERACGQDAQLRARLVALLTEHDAAEADGPSDAVLDLGVDAHGVLATFETPVEEAPEVAGYRVVGLVGVGGMGTVWEAEQQRPRRRVALKLMRPELCTREGLRRFEREADLLARLRHPGVAQVFEQGLATTTRGTRPYLTMEFVEGLPLTTHVRKGGLAHRQRLECLARVCEAVGHLHANGVLHRDLKPGNILVCEDGTPKVLDFGVARPLDVEGTQRTQAGTVVGTLAYMSPEQAAGADDRADSRSDVYALGVLAYEVLAERSPYDLEGRGLASVIRSIQEDDAPPLGRVDRRLRGDVAAIVAKALEKEPGRRYASAGEMAADLRRHLADEPIIASRVAPIHQLRKFVRRNKTLVAASATLVLALVGGLLASLHYMGVAEEEARVARTASRLSRLQAASAALTNHEPGVLRDHLDAIPVEQRHWAWRYLDAQSTGSIAKRDFPLRPRTVDVGPGGTILAGGAIEAAFQESPAGPWSAQVPIRPSAHTYTQIAGQRRLVWTKGETFDVRDLPTGAVLRHFEGTTCRAKAASADRRRVALFLEVHDRSRIEVYDTATFASVWTLPNAAPDALALSHDGSRLALVQGERLRVFEVGRSGPTATLPAQGRCTSIAFSPDGTHVATAAPDQTVWITDLDAGERTRALEGIPTGPDALRFLDDRMLAVCHTRGTVEVRDVETGERQALWFGHTEPVQAIERDADIVHTASRDGARDWALLGAPPVVLRVHGAQSNSSYAPFVYFARMTPDGGRIVSGGWDGFVRITDLATGRALTRLPTDIVKLMSLSGDGRTVIGGDASLGVFDAETGQTEKVIPAAERLCVAANRDASLLAFGRADGTIEVYDRVTGATRVRVSPASRYKITSVTFDKGGTRIAAASDVRTVRVLRTSDGGLVRTFDCKSTRIYTAAFDRSGRLLATGTSGGRASVWDLASGREVCALIGNGEQVYAVAFSASGRELATGSSDGIVRIYEVPSGALLLRLQGHREYVKDVSFSDDGRTLLSASGDGTIRIWSTVPMAERWHEKEALLAAEATMAAWIEKRGAKGVSAEALLSEASADPSLSALHRRALVNLLLEAAPK